MLINTILPAITLLFAASNALPVVLPTAAAAPAELILHGGFATFGPAEPLAFLPKASQASSKSALPSALSASIKASDGESIARVVTPPPPIAIPSQIHLPSPGTAPSPPISIPGRQVQSERLAAVNDHEMASPSSSLASSQSELMFPIDDIGSGSGSAISRSPSFASSQSDLRHNLQRGINPVQSPPRDSPSSPPTLNRQVIRLI